MFTTLLFTDLVAFELYDELSDLRYFLSFSRSASKSNVP